MVDKLRGTTLRWLNIALVDDGDGDRGASNSVGFGFRRKEGSCGKEVNGVDREKQYRGSVQQKSSWSRLRVCHESPTIEFTAADTGFADGTVPCRGL
jgi:hypothetical protein